MIPHVLTIQIPSTKIAAARIVAFAIGLTTDTHGREESSLFEKQVERFSDDSFGPFYPYIEYAKAEYPEEPDYFYTTETTDGSLSIDLLLTHELPQNLVDLLTQRVATYLNLDLDDVVIIKAKIEIVKTVH